MSLYAEGLLVPSVAFDARPRTVLSRAFSNGLMGSRNKTKLLFTTVVDPYGPLSFLVNCDISASELCPDFSLGLDWAAYLRDSLIAGLDLRLDSSFDAWTFFSHPSRPLSSREDATGLPPSTAISHKAVATAPPRATDSTDASLPLTVTGLVHGPGQANDFNMDLLNAMRLDCDIRFDCPGLPAAQNGYSGPPFSDLYDDSLLGGSPSTDDGWIPSLNPFRFDSDAEPIIAENVHHSLRRSCSPTSYDPMDVDMDLPPTSGFQSGLPQLAFNETASATSVSSDDA
ncbi:hypothetical protein DFH09DRAFT_1320194 [Mycena vulgaris]|nr:hypothetical protein DFH09DRAFT_1320194 [Mycena vulgaris]